MSDVDFGFNGLAGIIFLISLASIVLIGFLPGFYFFYRNLKISSSGKLIIAFLIGIFLGYISFETFSNLFAFHVFGDSVFIWYIPLVLLLSEIVAIFMHYRRSLKSKKTSKAKKNK